MKSVYPTETGSLLTKPLLQPKITRWLEKLKKVDTWQKPLLQPNLIPLKWAADKPKKKRSKVPRLKQTPYLWRNIRTFEVITPQTKRRPRRKTNPKTTEVRPLTATLRLNKGNRTLSILLDCKQNVNFILLDTCAKQSALSENELRCIIAAHPSTVLDELPAADYKIYFANGNILPVRKQVLLHFFPARQIFQEQFMVVPTMGNILIGGMFSIKNSITLDLKSTLVRLSSSLTATPIQTREIQICSVWTQGHTESSSRSIPASVGSNNSRFLTRDVNRHHWSYISMLPKIWPQRNTNTKPTTRRRHENPSNEL